MGSTEWGSQEVGSPQRRGTAGRHALSRSLQDPEAAPAGKSAGRKRELAAHNLVRPGTCSCPEAREERAEKEKKDSGFPSHPGLPGECQHSRAGSRADGCPGDGTGEHPRCLSGDILPGARQEPCNVAGKGGNCMADKAVDPQYPSCPQHIQDQREPRERHMTVASARGCHHADERKCLPPFPPHPPSFRPRSGQGAGKEHSLR